MNHRKLLDTNTNTLYKGTSHLPSKTDSHNEYMLTMTSLKSKHKQNMFCTSEGGVVSEIWLPIYVQC